MSCRCTDVRRIAGALAAMAVMLVCASTASANLSLLPIAGPTGAVPFTSPGGMGPTFVASPPGDTHRVFVGTKDGYIYIVKNGVTLPTPFLDIHTQVSTTNEDGMFSIAFDPDYATNRRFYVDYSDTVANAAANKNVDNYHLDAFQTSATNPDVADPATQTQILFNPTSGCQDMSSAHYGGQLAFGPDGHLWLSLGDGGDGGGDPATRGPTCDRSSPLWAPDLTSIRGKILRIDPQPTADPDASGNRYTIPSDNPLVGQGGGVRTEVWADGLRNPWRFSFDSATGNLVIGDVGNAQQEEVDEVPSTLAPGAHPPFFGWPCTEGDAPFFGSSVCAGDPAPVAPKFVFDHTGPADDADCTAIIGGVVLHDPSLGAGYDGRYLYGYFCGGTDESIAGHLLTTDLNSPIPTPQDEGVSVDFGLSSFGVDGCGHPYATNVVKGGLWRITGTGPNSCAGDTTPPDTTITSGPSGLTNTTSATFAFSSTEAGSAFTCQLDSGSAQACTSPLTLNGLSQGSHTVKVIATDAAGNPDPTPASRTWTVDTTSPDTTITSGPSAATNTTSATFAFSSTEAGSTFTCQLDSGSAQACTSPHSYNALADGSHTVIVTATDAAGNPDPTPASRTWTVDTTSPDTTITGGPSGLTDTASATFAFSSTEAGSTFTCQLDSATTQACTSPQTYNGLGDGSHTFKVTAINAAGTADPTPATRSWTVDTAAPDTTITSGPTGLTNVGAASFAFSSADAGATFTCKLDSGAETPCTSPVSYTTLADGGHTVTVTAVDAAGNSDPTPATRAWSVDTVPPDTTLVSAPSGPVASTGAAVSFMSSEAGSTFACSVDGGGTQACTSPLTLSGLAQGPHTVSVVAIDAAGNPDTSPATATWIVDTIAPDTTITGGPPASDTNTTATFTFTSSESPATYRCALDGAAAACISPATFTGLGNGPHSFTVAAADAAGNADKTPATRSWTVALPAPPPTTTTTTTTTAPPPTQSTTTTTTAPPPPTTTTTQPVATPQTTPVTPKSPPRIHVSLRGIKTLVADRHGKLHLGLASVGQSATGVLTLRSGARTLAPTLRFKMTRTRGATLVLALSSSTRASLRRHRWLNARLTLTMTGAGSHATTAVSVRIGMTR